MTSTGQTSQRHEFGKHCVHLGGTASSRSASDCRQPTVARDRFRTRCPERRTQAPLFAEQTLIPHGPLSSSQECAHRAVPPVSLGATDGSAGSRPFEALPQRDGTRRHDG